MKPIRYEKTQSTLLIPAKFLDIFIEKTEGIPRGIYFHFLLKKYKSLALDGLLPKPDKIKTEYQEKGQFLVKKNFRPFNSDWIELGILADWLGYSRTAIFSWFLILDLAGWDKILSEKFFDGGVPPKVSTLQLKNILTKRNTVRWKRKIYGAPVKSFSGKALLQKASKIAIYYQ